MNKIMIENKFTKMTDSEYFSLPFLSNSFLINFDRSPAHAFIPKEPTDFMEFGTMIHRYILEPELFYNFYTVIPENLKLNENGTINKVAKENKDWLATIGELLPVSKIIIEKLETIKKYIYEFDFNGQKLGNIIENSQKELTGLFIFEDIQCKMKIDCLYESLGSYIIFDLKKTQNCLDFQKSVNTYKYYRQAAFYLTGLEKITGYETDEFYFITVEEKDPFGVKVYKLNSDYIIQGLYEVQKSIDNYKKWLERGSNKLECYSNEIETLNKPDWLKS